MADLSLVLPDFDLLPWRHLTFSLDKKNVLTAELVTLDPMNIAKRCPLPLKEVRRISIAVKQALVAAFAPAKDLKVNQFDGTTDVRPAKVRPNAALVKTLDPGIDKFLGGGFPVGSVCEVVGESGVGKTQFVLSLLLSAQLPAPVGLGRNVMYISTEGRLNTTRLLQILRTHPHYQNMSDDERPNLDRIMTVEAPTFELQENIIHYQVEHVVRARDVGFIVIDSIAANFRVAYPGSSPKVLIQRAIALLKLGDRLRRIANDLDVAVVLTNQVSDRFDEKNMQGKIRYARSQQPPIPPTQAQLRALTPAKSTQKAGSISKPNNTQKTAAATGPRRLPIPMMSQAKRNTLLSLDYQQQFFTGWGHDPDVSPFTKFKNPTLGLSWASQLSMRIVLKFEGNEFGSSRVQSEGKRPRCIQIAFSPIAPLHHHNHEYELLIQGPKSVNEEEVLEGTDDRVWLTNYPASGESQANISDEDAAYLNPKYWSDDEIT